MSDSDRDAADVAARAAAPIDPVRLARRDLKKGLPRRFYAEASFAPTPRGFAILLDGKAVLTPAKASLVVPTAPLADALAAEWRAQDDIIDPDVMPMTRLANSAIDGVASAREATAAAVAKFAETDLVCYRAGDPAALVDAQAAAWDPVLAFARDEIGARFLCATGVMYVAQPEAARAAVRRAVDAIAAAPHGTFRLAALSVMANLTGSVLLALAVAQARLTAESAWAAAHVDEDYQIRFWGADVEATDRRRRRWRDMDAAARFDRLAATGRMTAS